VLPDAQRCFDAARLPKGNVRRAEWPGRGYNETFRLRLFEGLQSHLLHELQYTHSLIVDIDELLLPSPRYAGSLRTYLQHSSFAHRRYVMPTAYVVLPAPALGEPTGLNWTSRPLLARRHTWMRECGLSKIVLTRVRATYISSTHQAKELPWYNPFMCIKTWGRDPAESLRDCVDPELVLIHMKCADPEIWTAPAPQLIASWQRDPDSERKRWAEYQSHFWQTYCGKAQHWATHPPSGTDCRGGLADQEPLPQRCRDAYNLERQQAVWRAFFTGVQPGWSAWRWRKNQGDIEQIPAWVRQGV